MRRATTEPQEESRAGYGAALLCVGVATAIGLILDPWVDGRAQYVVFLAAVSVTAHLCKPRAALVAAGLAVVLGVLLARRVRLSPRR